MKHTQRLELRLSVNILDTLDSIRKPLAVSRAKMIRNLITSYKGQPPMDSSQSTIDPTLFYGPGRDKYAFDEDDEMTPEYSAYEAKNDIETHQFAQKYPDINDFFQNDDNDDIWESMMESLNFKGWDWAANLEFYHRAKQRKADRGAH